MSLDLRLTYIGGPTLLLQVGGLRLLTDPTFDPAGAEFRSGAYVLRKTHGPGLPSAALGRVDAVLLSHDHHFDNLDAAGRGFLGHGGSVLTTGAGAER
ncbi:MAG TPA: MBL fold metallo-hydrolase, partial [Methylomirabilota bacterium]